jgi:Leucine-rich repeat (LRR) protein
VSGNRLQELHPNFTYIFLNKLIASGNLISELPNMFLPSLEELYLDRNKIEREVLKVVYLPSLKVLNLDENCVSGFCVVWSLLRYSRNL